MITIDTLLCGAGTAGTYFDGCKVTPKDYTKLFLLSPSVSIDLTSGLFDRAARALLIKQGKLVAIEDILQVNEAGAKNNFQTMPNKRKLFVSGGLYEFMAELEANVCLVKSLHKLIKRNWSLLLLDSEGKLFFDNVGGKLQGFELAYADIDNETINDGGSKLSMVTLAMQLTQDGTAGYNQRRSYLVSDQFYGTNGIQDVKLKSVSLNAANVVISVVAGCDGSTPISGLTAANFKVIKASDGTTVTATVVDNGDGTYKFSTLTAGDYTIQIYDSVANLPVADILLTQFFQSNTLAISVTA